MRVQPEGLTDPEHAMPAEGVGFGGGKKAFLSFIELVEDLFLFVERINHALNGLLIQGMNNL